METNPFRLWGSYIGLAVGAVFAYLSFATIRVFSEFGSVRPTAFILPVIPLVLGFLIGWGIHALIKNKK